MGIREDVDDALDHVPLVDHEGKSGARLERAVLADGRRVVVKRYSPEDDLVMAATGDLTGREYSLWDRGVLDRLPDLVGHAVIGGWLEDDVAVLVMRDLGESVLTWQHRLAHDRCHWMLERVAGLHLAFLGEAPADLTAGADLIGLFSPQRLGPYANGANPLPRQALRGWQIFAETVPADVAGPVLALLEEPAPLVTALERGPVTLLHGDLATVNMAFEGDRLTLLDWSMPARLPGAVDVARFVAGCASVVDMSREELIGTYLELAGPAADEESMRLALLGGLVWLGWNKALDAAENPDTAVRAREQRDLGWWVREARLTLETGML